MLDSHFAVLVTSTLATLCAFLIDSNLAVLVAAFLAMISAVTAPVLTQHLANRQRTTERTEDFKRQDAVAEAFKKTHEQLLNTTKESNGKLDIIHTLVNSGLTAAIQAELDATVRELASLQEIVDLKRASKLEPTVATVAAIKAAQVRITELIASLKDRRQQAEIVEAQQKNQAAAKKV